MRRTRMTGIPRRMNLQFFAESGDGAGADQCEGSGAENKLDEGSAGGAENGDKEPKSSMIF
ncbi:hypothetical protein [Clostridium sp. AM58-1XD]|uniref:hypothetical protein n=1 Tax=Clostridium sp. AM58-1XD TaxID=2292307 RepID=UPI0015F36699